MRWRTFAVVAFLFWETWWVYVYFSATIPDEKYHTIFALIMGIGMPIWLAVVVGGALWMIRWVKRSVSRD